MMRKVIPLLLLQNGEKSQMHCISSSFITQFSNNYKFIPISFDEINNLMKSIRGHNIRITTNKIIINNNKC